MRRMVWLAVLAGIAGTFLGAGIGEAAEPPPSPGPICASDAECSAMFPGVDGYGTSPEKAVMWIFGTGDVSCRDYSNDWRVCVPTYSPDGAHVEHFWEDGSARYPDGWGVDPDGPDGGGWPSWVPPGQVWVVDDLDDYAPSL